ncbi:hypothetical protein BTVI_33811 [Pitangus sulphuratus]|nr:hypothetical protein BTVI_33811 [Pitangus sulphuratus]
MLSAAALVCVCAAAWCSPAAAAAAGGRPDSGNFLDDKQWLTTISQYDKEVGQWNKFRDSGVLITLFEEDNDFSSMRTEEGKKPSSFMENPECTSEDTDNFG